MDVRTDAPQAQVGAPTDDVRSGGTKRRRLLGIATLVGLPVLLYLGLFFAPEDAEQGPAQRIFYIHVPSAWIGFFAFFVVFIASIAVLSTGKRKWDDLASASAEVGLVFTTAVLITGPLWGRPVWGVFWTWDPRLTSFMMLWLIYLSYLILRGYVPEPEKSEEKKPEDTAILQTDAEFNSFEKDIETFETMDMNSITNKIRGECKTLIQQLHLEHRTEDQLTYIKERDPRELFCVTLNR